MKLFSNQNIWDQRKLLSHLVMLFISLIILGVFSAIKSDLASPKDYITFLLLVLLQIELFIFLAARIFSKTSRATTSEEITKIVVSRFLVFIVLCFLVALLIVVIYSYIINLIQGLSSTQAFTNFFKYGFRSWFKMTIGGLLFGAALFIYAQWQDALKKMQTLREQNLIFQNETLKNQINPHFLYNSLNTLSSLLKTEPEVAEEFINKMSSIYRYILENSSKNQIPLETELSFINDYFYLHKIRDNGKIELETDIHDAARFEILPVSVQGLIENAIKHNRATREEPLNIKISIEGEYLAVKNNLQKMASQIRSSGTGLKNLSERIKIITGKDIIIEEGYNYFIVKVPLIL